MSHGLSMANVPTARPSAGDHELDAEAGRREEPGLADAVPAAEPQDEGQQDVVDADEDDGCGQAREGEAEITVLADRVDCEPRRETAEREVRDVERLDVPRVAIADRERDVQRDHERDDEERRQDERSRDHERRPGVEAVIPADGDAEERRNRGERKQGREGPPLGSRRRVSCDGDGRRDDGGKGDERRRRRRPKPTGGELAGTATPRVLQLLGRSFCCRTSV